MDNYLQRINSFVAGLDSETSAALKSISSETHYKKGDLMLKQGDVCTKSYLILDGIARKFYLNDGKEITTEIYFTNDLAISFASYTLQQPSKEYLEAITDITVSVISYKEFQQAKVLFPDLVALDLMLVEYYGMWMENRLFQFQTFSASERYVELLTKSPHFLRAIPLTILASYLGISLETLSRVRAKI